MAGLTPEPGLVIPYVYLWRRQHEAGEESGRKARPAVVVVVILSEGSGKTRVAIAPVTTQEPGPTRTAVEIPGRVLAHLGLPASRSWVICDEYNAFEWPGADLAKTASGQGHFGFLPDQLIERIRREMSAARDRGALKRVPRSS